MPRSKSGSSAGSAVACDAAPVKSDLPEMRRPAVAERARVLVAPREHADLGDAREVPGVEAADHPRADDADSLDRHVSTLTG